MVLAYSICLSLRFSSLLSASSLARMSRLFSGVRSSCDMLARNSDLYLEMSASCSAFSSSETRACSTSRFLISTFWFCSSRSLAFSSSSSAWRSSSALDPLSSSCCTVSSLDWLCSSWVSPWDWRSSSSVRMLALIMLSTTPMLSMSWSRKSWWIVLKWRNEASSMTALTSPSKSTGRTMIFSGVASPRPELIWM